MFFTKELHALFHLLYPHTCVGCDSDIIQKEQLLCARCLDRLPLTHFIKYANNPVEKIFAGRLPVQEAAGFLYFHRNTITQRLVHQLKYKGNKDIGIHIGHQMADSLLQSKRFQHIDALVPVPLFAAREKKRGYNQATIICKGLSEKLGLPVLERVIKRQTASSTQTKKNRAERWQNIAGKFSVADPASIAGMKLLLVDDVVTTGATLEACGQELLSAGNIRLSILTMACAYNN